MGLFNRRDRRPPTAADVDEEYDREYELRTTAGESSDRIGAVIGPAQLATARAHSSARTECRRLSRHAPLVNT